jgi:hypothetical protein
MSGGVVVDITAVSNATEPPLTRLAYAVCNAGGRPVWMVDDGWLVFRQDGDRIELSFARGRLQKGVQVFGYFAPAVLRLDCGEIANRHVTLTWPLPLDRIWNAERIAAPAPGEYRLSVGVGYGMTPQADAPNSDESVDAGIRRWQRLALSAPVIVRISAYKGSPQDLPKLVRKG